MLNAKLRRLKKSRPTGKKSSFNNDLPLEMGGPDHRRLLKKYRRRSNRRADKEATKE